MMTDPAEPRDDADRPSEMADTFDGDTTHLITCIEALIDLSDRGKLLPHGLGGHARGFLETAAVRLASHDAATDALRWIDRQFANQDLSHKDFRVEAAGRARSVLTKSTA